MNGFTSFLATHYVWFIIITIILVFALIGYFVDSKEIKSGKVKNTKDSDLKIVDFSSVDQNKSLGSSIKDADAGSLNLDNYANAQANVKNQVAQPAPAPVQAIPTDVSAPQMVAQPDMTNVQQVEATNPLSGSTTDYQQTQALEKPELVTTPVVEETTDASTSNSTLLSDSESSINVV